MFSKAIVRKPGKSMIKGLTKANLGIPDYHRAIDQHESYVCVLKNYGNWKRAELSVTEILKKLIAPDAQPPVHF